MRVPVSWHSQVEVPVGPQRVDLAPHPVVGLVILVGDADKFPPALGFESLN